MLILGSFVFIIYLVKICYIYLDLIFLLALCQVLSNGVTIICSNTKNAVVFMLQNLLTSWHNDSENINCNYL